MAGRGAQTFKKRQKEQQRKEKQQEKVAKRLQRKLDKENGVVNVDDNDDLLLGEASPMDESEGTPGAHDAAAPTPVSDKPKEPLPIN